jgi:hypothetical protein
MHMASAWSALQQQGFALAASAHDDRGAERALPGLAADVAEQATARARELAGLDRAGRQRWLRAALANLAPAPALRGGAPLAPASALRGGAPPEIATTQPSDRPARALALLAADVPREVGRAWLAAAPPPRPGYAPDPRLLAWLRVLCAKAPPRSTGALPEGEP